jgi:predicted AAA+ superfamily ATPase
MRLSTLPWVNLEWKMRIIVAELHVIRQYHLMFTRILGLHELLLHSSVFLFGPRQTGKSTLLRTLFPQAKFYDLLEADTFRELSAAPELIRQRLQAEDTLVIIDEIQKLPLLLRVARLE